MNFNMASGYNHYAHETVWEVLVHNQRTLHNNRDTVMDYLEAELPGVRFVLVDDQHWEIIYKAEMIGTINTTKVWMS